MKKILFIIAVISILSGCGTNDSLVCTDRNKIGNISSNTTYKIDYRGNDVKKLVVTYAYNDGHTDGIGTGTDGTTEDSDVLDETDGVVDGIVGEALDDVVTGVTDTILDLADIRTRHNNRFGTYTNTPGFMMSIDTDSDDDYKVTYTYDFNKLSDTDIANFGISSDFDNLKSTYTNRGLTCE